MRVRTRHLAFPLIAAFLLTACSGLEQEQSFPESRYGRQGTGSQYDSGREKLFGKDGFSLFGSGEESNEGGGGGSGIAVNSFLWRASLDTVSFMPLAAADPFGGVIITDWYAPPESPDERFKINVYILDRQLRANGLRVAVFKQSKIEGEWRNADVGETTPRSIEDKILTRARELRVQSASAG